MSLCATASRVGLGVLIVCAASPARAALLSYEGFDYTRGESIHAKAGGSGWSIPWNSGSANQSVFGPGLAHPGVGPSVGNALGMANAAALRYFGADIDPGTTEFWASVLVRRGSAGAGGFFRFVGPTGSEQTFGFGSAFGVSSAPAFLAEVQGTNTVATAFTSPALGVDVTDLLVVRVSPQAGGASYRADLYVNPTINSQVVGASLTVARTSVLRGIVLTGSNAGTNMVFDEVRVGETLADVTSIPGPGAGVLVLALFAGRRRGGVDRNLGRFFVCSGGG